LEVVVASVEEGNSLGLLMALRHESEQRHALKTAAEANSFKLQDQLLTCQGDAQEWKRKAAVLQQELERALVQASTSTRAATDAKAKSLQQEERLAAAEATARKATLEVVGETRKSAEAAKSLDALGAAG
jgi:hypothetical protein